MFTILGKTRSSRPSLNRKRVSYMAGRPIFGAKPRRVKLRPCIFRTERQLDDIPQSILKECALILKTQAKFKREILPIVYTYVSNVSSNGPTGEVKSYTLKSKQFSELQPKKQKIDFEKENAEFMERNRLASQEKFRLDQLVQQEANKQNQEIADQKRKGYTDLYDDESVMSASNQNRAEDWEEDFV